jgi:ribosomal protein S18 acetylase RimI-like enzyme
MNNNDIEKISLSVKPENLNAIKSYSKNGWKIGKQTKTSIQMYKLI